MGNYERKLRKRLTNALRDVGQHEAAARVTFKHPTKTPTRLIEQDQEQEDQS